MTERRSSDARPGPLGAVRKLLPEPQEHSLLVPCWPLDLWTPRSYICGVWAQCVAVTA